MKCTILKTAPMGAGPDFVNIALTDKKSGIQFCEVQISMEEFGKMMAAPQFAECEVELRALHNIGKRHEHKREVVPFDAMKHRGAEAKEAALKPFEVDGWRGHASDLGNMHRSNKAGGFTVTFHRFVEDD